MLYSLRRFRRGFEFCRVVKENILRKKLLLFILLLLLSIGVTSDSKPFYVLSSSTIERPIPLLNVSKKLMKDPFVLKEDNKYYMLYTFGNSPWDADIGYAISNDGVNWVYKGVLIKHNRAWGEHQSPVWAPFIIKKDGLFYLYVSGVVKEYKMGIFSSKSITGSWKWRGFVKDETDVSIKGIDPKIIKYQSTYYYICAGKNDNEINLYQSDTIFRWHFIKTILTTNQEWEGKIIEAPKLIKLNNKFYLYYGANDSELNQRIGLAISDNINGPYKKIGKISLHYPGAMPGAISHPDIIKINKFWYLYVSISEAPNYFIVGYRSKDLVNWHPIN